MERGGRGRIVADGWVAGRVDRCAATAAEKMRRVAPVVCDAILRAVVEGLEVEMAPWRRSRALETLRGW